MARKLKHSKIKNTGILFELLTRQITADVLAGKSTKTVKIVKKYFNETTELGKELQFYRILSEKHYQSESRARDLLEAVVDSRKKLSNSKLRNEKYNLIKDINENYNSVDFFNGLIKYHCLFRYISISPILRLFFLFDFLIVKYLKIIFLIFSADKLVLTTLL